MKKFIAYILFSLIIDFGFSQSGIKNINFETTLHNDTSLFKNDTSGLWQIGIPSKTFLSSAVSLPNAIVTDTLNPYPINANSSFEIDWVGCFYVSADLQYQLDSCYDGLIIEMYAPDSNSWINMLHYPYGAPWWMGMEWHDYNVVNVKDTCTLANGETAISGTGSQNIDLHFWSIFVNRDSPSDKIKFRFRIVSDSIFNGNEGVLIDNIIINYYTCIGSIIEDSHSEFSISPNPVTDKITITSSQNMNEVKITNLVGDCIISIANNFNSIDLSELPSGLYFISSAGFKTQKFIKL